MYNFLKNISNSLSNFKTIRVLASLLMLALLSTIIINNHAIWLPIVSTIMTALKPFIFGTILAYVLAPTVTKFQKFGLNRISSVFAVMLIFLLFVMVIMVVILPVLFENGNLLATVLIEGFKELTSFVNNNADSNNFFFSIAQEILTQINSAQFTTKLTGIASTSTSVVFNIAKSVVSGLITAIFAFVIAVYLLLQKDKFVGVLKKLIYKFDDNAMLYASQINQQMRIYLRAIGLVMLSKAPAYLTFYYLIGHKNWLMLGILMIFTVLIPYLGPLVVNTLAIITSLTQGTTVILLTCLVVCYSMFIDTYIIDPKIYGHAVKLEPLMVIFAIFLGGALLGILGILLAIPVSLIIRVIVNTRISIKQNNF